MPHHKVAEAVGHEVDFAHAFESANYAVERAGMRVDAAASRGIAHAECGVAAGVVDMFADGRHRGSRAEQTVEKNYGPAFHRRELVAFADFVELAAAHFE